jgi:hypothetical protein
MLIVLVAPTITGIVIAAPEVQYVTVSDCDGSTFIFIGFHGRCGIYTQNYCILPAAFDINIFCIFNPKIGLLKCNI